MRFFIAVLFILFSICCTAQKQANIWYFGNHAGLNFNDGAPIAFSNSALNSDEASAVMSDKNGELLFYTDGVTVWNRLNQSMPNGHNVSQLTTQVLIVPLPASDSIYFIFTASPGILGVAIDSVGFHYSLVNINKSNSLGNVVVKRILLFKNTTEKMAATYHSNGEDIWLMCHEWNNNVFRSYLMTSQGIDSTAVVKSSIGLSHSPTMNNFPNTSGQMKFSPDGKKIAVAVGFLGVQLFDFDASTGMLSNPVTLNGKNICLTSEEFFGLEFSPDGNLLYFNVSTDCPSDDFIYIFQYNIATANTEEIFKGASINLPYGALQLAPDGKIYVVNAFNAGLDVIEKPNNAGLACGLVPNAIDLSPGQNRLGLPNFIQSYFLFDDPAVTMPNVFTPNGDSLNPRFVPIQFENIGSASLTIINRWGEQIFYSENPQAGWDGGNFSAGTYY